MSCMRVSCRKVGCWIIECTQWRVLAISATHPFHHERHFVVLAVTMAVLVVVRHRQQILSTRCRRVRVCRPLSVGYSQGTRGLFLRYIIINICRFYPEDLAEHARTSPSSAGMLRGLLDKLEPMAMMEDGGMQKASIAIEVLVQKAADPPTASGIVDAGGVKLLIQTMLLHPAPALRHGAARVLTTCIEGADSIFLQRACDDNLPGALVRVLAENDRRVKKPRQKASTEAVEAENGDTAPEEQAYDPDLPVRQVGLVGFESLLIHSSVAPRLLADWPGMLLTAMQLCVNTNLEIRQRAAALLRTLLTDQQPSNSTRSAEEVWQRPGLPCTLLPDVAWLCLAHQIGTHLIGHDALCPGFVLTDPMQPHPTRHDLNTRPHRILPVLNP